MRGFGIFKQLYNFFSGHRLFLFFLSAVIIGLSALAVSGIKLSEDVKSMLPDNRQDFSTDFELLQHAPFAHKIILNLKSGPGVEVKQLIEAADNLAGAMKPPFFTRVLTGPGINQDLDFYNWMIKMFPNIATSGDLEAIKAGLTADNIKAHLKEDYDSLLSPEGWFLKNFIKSDPLNFKVLGLKKLSYINIIPNVRLQDNHFVDGEGKSVLLIAETNVGITDAASAEKMLSQLNELIKKNIPPPIEVSVLSAHNYTVANAETIKKDLFIVLTISSLSVIILYLLFLRSWSTVFVLLISFASFSIALAGMSLIFKGISAIIIGFGSALLGLYDEFCLLVYFALRPEKARSTNHDPASIMAEVSRPVLFGGVITLSVFFLLIMSDLPGQRQLGIFTILGVIASLVMSLVLLPHMMQASGNKKDLPGLTLKRRPVSHPLRIITIWVVLLAGFAWFGKNITFSGDLNSINYIPKELRQTEQMIKKTWGNVRSQAMVFAQGQDLESALEINDAFFKRLSETKSDGILSISPILPSKKTQELNQQAWKNFWSERKADVRLTMGREGRELGFSEDAFDEFFASLDATPAILGSGDLNVFGISEIIDSMIIRSGGKVGVLTLVPDTDEMRALATNFNNGSNIVRFVSQSHFSESIKKPISRDFTRFILSALLVVIIMLTAIFRDTKKILLSLIPILSGMIFMFGVMSWFKMTFNIFNIISSIIVIGEGVDFGIFMVCKSSEDYGHDTDTTVFLSGLTSITGFGALIFARHPALHSIGTTVLLGIIGVILSALFVIPAFYNTKKRPVVGEASNQLQGSEYE